MNFPIITLSQYRNFIKEEFQITELWEIMYKKIIEATFKNIS